MFCKLSCRSGPDWHAPKDERLQESLQDVAVVDFNVDRVYRWPDLSLTELLFSVAESARYCAIFCKLSCQSGPSRHASEDERLQESLQNKSNNSNTTKNRNNKKKKNNNKYWSGPGWHASEDGRLQDAHGQPGVADLGAVQGRRPALVLFVLLLWLLLVVAVVVVVVVVVVVLLLCLLISVVLSVVLLFKGKNKIKKETIQKQKDTKNIKRNEKERICIYIYIYKKNEKDKENVIIIEGPATLAGVRHRRVHGLRTVLRMGSIIIMMIMISTPYKY